MPSKKRKDGTFKDIAHPLNNQMRQYLEEKVLSVYKQQLSAQTPSTPSAPAGGTGGGEPAAGGGGGTPAGGSGGPAAGRDETSQAS
jgi:hypothetical protein